MPMALEYTHDENGSLAQQKQQSPKKPIVKSFTPKSINAERFIPKHKRVQWDSIPSIIIASLPCTVKSNKTTPIERWIYNPEKRRSLFDASTFNILNHIPQCQEYLKMCLVNLSAPPTFLPQTLSSYSSHIQRFYHKILENQSMVKKLESELISYSELDPSVKSLSIEAIKLQYQTSRNDFSMNRVIQATPELLAKVCDEIQSVMERNTSGCSESVLDLSHCQKMACKDYMSKINILMDIERLQANEDVKAYDMYSCRFDYIEIPPLAKTKKNSRCPGCSRKYSKPSSRFDEAKYCFYHANLMNSYDYTDDDSFPFLEQSQGYYKASAVRTVGQFNYLMNNLRLNLDSRNQKIIAYLTVPGIAENRPLVSVGDLLRLRFGTEEVIAEVGAVTIKSETVMLFLPLAPYPFNIDAFPLYMEALKNPKNLPDEFSERHRSGSSHAGRFDVRFGLFSSRAHEIFKTVSTKALSRSFDQIVRVLAPTPMLEDVQKKSARRPHLGIAEWSQDLNAEQKNAVFDIVRKNHGQAPYCIYGPPGTGKTMTVCESIVQILRYAEYSRILVCAPSDAACDVIAKRLIRVLPKNSKALRINWWSRNPASLPPTLLSCSRMDAKGFFRMPSQEEICEVNVVICQCFVAGCLELETPENRSWMDEHFTHVFIDESSQSFEFESLIPLLKVSNYCSIILAGDPKQLGPSTRSSCASSNGLCLSLQERLMGLSLYQAESNFSVITKLLDNYRSHDALLQVPSELFYGGSLRCKASAKVTSVCKNFELLPDGENFPMMVYDVKDGTEQSKIDTPSFYNLQECWAIARIIKALLSSNNVTIHAGQIAVITCFRAQVLKMRSILRKEGLPTINVGVVEDFQGQETSVVLISTVLTKDQARWKTGTESGFGFMTDPRRFNVAITRASALCVIVGKVDYLEASGSYWTSLIEHIRRNEGTGGETNITEREQKEGTIDYGIDMLVNRVAELNLLGGGHEMDRYNLAMRGYYEDAPEWKVCL